MFGTEQKKYVTRRQFLTSAAAAVAGTAVAACAPKPATPTAAPAQPTAAPEQPTAAPEEPTAPPAEQVALTILTPYGTWAESMITTVTENYTQLNPNVTWNPTIWGESEQAGYVEALLARVAAGNPPDIAILWDTPVTLGVRGALNPLDDLMVISTYSKAENWPQDLAKSCVWRGKTYGFASFNACYSLWYNTDAFEEAGLSPKREDFPKTWDELREVSAKFTQWDDGKLLRIGYFPVWTHWGVTEIFFLLNGGKVFDPENAQYTIDKEENAETLDYCVAWVDEQFKGDYQGVLQQGWAFLDVQGGEPAFQDGRNIIIHAGNFMMGMYRETPPQYNWDFAGFPIGPSGSKEYTMIWPNWTSIPAGTKYLNEAFAFLDWFNGEGVIYWSTTQPDMPGNNKFHEMHPDFLPSIVVEHRGEEFAREFQAFYKERLNLAGRVWESPINTFEFDQILRATEQTVNKVADARQALAEAQAACQAELDKFLSGV